MTSKINFKRNVLLLGQKAMLAVIAMLIVASVNAQEQKLPNNFTKKEIENFQGNKFDWKVATDVKPVIKKGQYLFKGKRPTFSPQPVSIVSYATLPFSPQSDFRITVNLTVAELTGHSVFQILLNSGSVVFAVTEKDWAVVVNNPACEGLRRTLKGDNVSLSVQKEGTKLHFSYNGTLLCSTEAEIKSSDIILSLGSIVYSAEIKINEVIVEQ